MAKKAPTKTAAKTKAKAPKKPAAKKKAPPVSLTVGCGTGKRTITFDVVEGKAFIGGLNGSKAEIGITAFGQWFVRVDHPNGVWREMLLEV